MLRRQLIYALIVLGVYLVMYVGARLGGMPDDVANRWIWLVALAVWLVLQASRLGTERNEHGGPPWRR